MSYRMSAHFADAPVRVFDNVDSYRAWRQTILRTHASVGFVPTMGALHEGHLRLVDRSLCDNDYTIVSIFVNPAQFAPHEDLSVYPRTTRSDIEQLGIREGALQKHGRLMVLLPQVQDMYPNGITQNVDDQIGAFIEVKGLSHQMEGSTRPTFFRGVATVVTKLFNVVMPDRAYFGQKDIQQAIVIRRLVDDLLFMFPHGSRNVHVLPTVRDPQDQLALSSRNKYLDAQGRHVAPVLYAALKKGQGVWDDLATKNVAPADRLSPTLEAVQTHLSAHAKLADGDHEARAELDYVALNHPSTLDPLTRANASAEGAILSGAIYVYNRATDPSPAARLIDNVLLGFTLN